jgi:hypothetical protein
MPGAVSMGRMDKLYADAPNGDQVARSAGCLAELVPQPREVSVEGLVVTAVRLIPDLGQQFAARHHTAGPGGQVEKQVELFAGQVQGVAGQRDRPAGRIDPELVDHYRFGSFPIRPAQDGPDTSIQLLGREGFDDVVVGACVEGPDDGGVIISGRCRDDRYGADGAQHLQELGSVNVRQAQIEDDYIRSRIDDLLQAGQASGAAPDLVAESSEGSPERVADPSVILDQSNYRQKASVPRAGT